MRKYRFVQKFVSRGIPHLYFRRKGYPLIALPGPLGSPEFILAWTAAYKGEPLPPASSLPGGVIAKRDQDPNTVQPLIGVYLLMLKGRVVYVGSSLHMPRRVAAHRSGCRPFDQVFYIPTKANQYEALERVLIKAINPEQNRAHRSFREQEIVNGTSEASTKELSR
jgi:predicted GIY-YIG superfamily endonuclease